MSNPNVPLSTQTPHTPLPRTAERTRHYVQAQPCVPPDYERFCEIHTRHRALWRMTYSAGQPAPYRAHSRHSDGITLAAGDLDTLEFALAQFTPPPPRTRPYLHRSGATAHPDRATTETARTIDPRDVRCLHQMADDLTASAHGHTYWTSEVRETALEMLTRLAAVLGEACGLRATAMAPEERPDRTSCLRPADHEGYHLDACGRSWDTAEEDAR
ncbi:hypothetical protein [Streptomonospora litoralis]|uniref:Uncharacterized protein n=1 Tax=Streptomonospora litoralis TaxID=2498135 RepID=A0A4P6QAP5_9ACTN|nr:hypothetical protein [Streptomonospora litoralis]QBI56649.1 hypothetical protein EKD16_24525 [Streptomonospora litoralis]